ncbi:MAG TPA: pre-peptidase C-terminal domain-containing protein [Thermoanaerobaculia bacterium]|nr:pre-peptidase C-terminal domain-containing protein [Thermoanaerobaculia bacterium]
MKTTLRALFAATLVLAALPALAGGPLALCGSGQPYVWPAGGSAIPFNPDQGPLGPLTNAQAVQLTQDAFDVWGAVATSTVSYVNAGLLPVDVDITNFGPYLNPAAPDGLSAIVFDDTGEIFDLLYGPGSGVLGFAGPEWANTIDCEILEGLSFLNGPSFGDPVAAFDVMVHEFGHYTNLAHTVVNGQLYVGLGDSAGPGTFLPYAVPNPFTEVVETMYPFYFGPGIGTGSLHREDIASVSALYPEPSFAATTGTISGTIFAPDGVTRVSGVNVIARNEADPFLDAVSAISGDHTDSVSQADPVTGTYTISGLTPGADYRVYVDEILAGGFSTPPLVPLPGPEEYHDGANESNNVTSPDAPTDFTLVQPSASGVDIVFNTPGAGDPLAVGDDGNVQLFLPFPFELCGQSFDSVFVNANGSLTFGAPSPDFSESVVELLAGPPRIAGLWDDLNPSAGGSVFYDQSANRFAVTWQDVPEYLATGANTFTIELKKSANHIEIRYGGITAADGLAGLSCGGAVTSGFEQPEDLGAFPGRLNLTQSTARFELFDLANPVDLAGDTVRFNGTKGFGDQFEPNDTLATASVLALPFDSIPNRRFTEIAPVGGDVDFFRFSAQAGRTLVAEVVNGQLDTLIVLADAAGNVLAVDDDGGSGLLSRIAVPVPADGDYFLGVTTFPDVGFTGAGGSGGRYVLDIQTLDGVLLTLGDDNSVEVTLPFLFPFQGSLWGSVFVNANGNLSFGSGNSDFSESVAELLAGPPRIAPLWDDLSPNNAGQVTVEQSATEWSVTYEGVPEFISTGSNTFTVTLSADGSIAIDYGAVSAADAVVGITQGGGAADPGETDLSAAGAQSATGTTYELFTFGDPFDLSGGSVTFTP